MKVSCYVSGYSFRPTFSPTAVAAVHEMVHASNFNKKMLLLATRLANESGMKHLLLSVLEALLDASTHGKLEVEAEAVTLVRCIIRLILRMMSEPGADS